MPDTITITDLEVWTKIGVLESERAAEQRLTVTIEITMRKQRAGQSDSLEDTIDYEAVARDIRSLSKAERKTVECFAEDIAAHVLAIYKPDNVCITLKKFMLPGTESVALSIQRP